MADSRHGPKQTLKNQLATIAELREMDAKTERRQTCGTCKITYKTEAAAKECRAWHDGR